MSNDESPVEVSNTVRSVERAIDLLEILMSTTRSISLTALSEETDLHPSTAHRLLATLDKKGFVHQDQDSKLYSLGPRLLLFLVDGSRSFGYLRNQVIPILQEITDVLGENASFSIRNGYKSMLLAQVSSGRLVDVRIQTSMQAPLHCTAVGKVMLAHLGWSEVLHIVDETGLPALTPNTITGIEALKQALDTVRECGYATDREEWVEGIRCVAVPVHSGEAQVVGVISVSAPSSRLDATREARFTEVIKRYAAKLSSRIAYTADDGQQKE
jgi:DNA-binding IclR family transcriptional regulator